MEKFYKFLIVFIALVAGGEVSAQNNDIENIDNSWTWYWGLSDWNVLTVTNRVEPDYGKNKDGLLTDPLLTIKSSDGTITSNGAIRLEKVKVNNEEKEVSIAFKVNNTQSRYSNVTIGIYLPEGTYNSTKGIKVTDSKNKETKLYFMGDDGEAVGDVKGYAVNELKLWDVVNGTYTITRNGANVGLFYIKVESQDGEYSITTLPGVDYEPALWRSFNYKDTENKIIMRAFLGGWKYQEGSRLEDCYEKTTKSYYKDQDNTAQVDSWDAAKTAYSPGAEDPYYYQSYTSDQTKRKLSPKYVGGQYKDYSYAQDNAKNEYIEDGYSGVYEFEQPDYITTPNTLYSTYGKVRGNPFTVPAFGDFIKLEPEANGRIKLYVMQNGAIEYDKKDVRKHETDPDDRADKDKRQETIKVGEETQTIYKYQGGLTSKICWRPLYIVDEAGTRLGEDDVTASTITEISIGRGDTEAYVYDFNEHFSVLCRKQNKIGDNEWEYANYKEGIGLNGEKVKYYDASGGGIYYKNDPNGYYVTYTDYDDKGNAYGKIFTDTDGKAYKAERMTYKDCFEALQFGSDSDKAHYAFYTSKFGNDEVWPSSVTTTEGTTSGVTGKVWGPKYTGDGWIVVSKGYVLYEFDVQAGKSYYVFSNDTKVGFCGYDFEKKNENPEPSLTLSDTYYNSNDKMGTYASVTLDRTFNAGWNAICLPFSVTESKMREWFGTDGKETYELVTYNGAAYEGSKLIAHFFHHVYQDIIAGYPYMLWIPSGAKAIENKVTFENVTIENGAEPALWSPFNTSHDYMPKGVSSLYDIATENDYIFTGFYSPKTIQKGSYIVTNETYDTSRGEFKGGLQLYDGEGAPDAKMKGFRSVLEPNGGASTAKEMVRISGTNFTNILDEVGADWQDATVINDIAEEMGFFSRPSNVYSVSGQLVRQNSTSLVGLPKGIYIVNGKKYFVN